MKPAESAAPMGPARRGETTLRMAIGQYESHANPAPLLCCIENKVHFSPEQLAFLQAMEEPLKRSSDHGQFLKHLYSRCSEEARDFFCKLSDSQFARVTEQTFNESLFKLKAIKGGEGLGKLGLRMVDGQVANPEEVHQAYAEITNGFNDLKSEPGQHRFKLLSYEDLGTLKGSPYLVDKIIVREELNMVFGPAGCGKTFLALDMALSVASGQPFLGLPTQQGPVVYIYAEGQRGAKGRIDAWLKHHGLKPEAIQENFRLIRDAVHLIEAEDQQELLNAIRQSGISPDLVVVDTLARAFCGGNPDQTADMSTFVSSCASIQRDFKSAVLLIHHPTKNDPKKDSGSYMLRGATSSVFHLAQKAGTVEGQKRLRFSCIKIKDADDAEIDLKLVLQRVDLEPDPDGNEQTSCVIRLGDAPNESPDPAPNQKIVFTALEQVAPQGLSIKELGAKTQLAGSSIHNVLTKLVEIGKASKAGIGKSTRYTAITASHPD